MTIKVPTEPTDEMIRASLAIDLPALFKTHLRHPDNGPDMIKQTELLIEKEKRRYKAILAAARGYS
jgi:hypothetical protein